MAARRARADRGGGARGRLALLAPVLACACLLPGAGAGSAQAGVQTIQATIRVDPALAARIAPGDRLVIKLFHPGAGIELDARYQIVEGFTLPLEVTVAPSIDMSGRTKYQDYVIEVFTDKDGDVLKVAPGELLGRTPAPVPLGTTGLVLELNQLRE